MANRYDSGAFRFLPGIEPGQTPDHIRNSPMAYRPYLETAQAICPMLTKGYPLPKGTMVTVIGNNTLLETSFRLRDSDKLPIEGVANPGKSAHISFTDCIEIATLAMFGRESRREDHMYTVSVERLAEIGIIAIYAPTRTKILHLRLVPETLDENGDIPQEIRAKLANLLQENEVQQSRTRRVY